MAQRGGGGHFLDNRDAHKVNRVNLMIHFFADSVSSICELLSGPSAHNLSADSMSRSAKTRIESVSSEVFRWEKQQEVPHVEPRAELSCHIRKGPGPPLWCR